MSRHDGCTVRVRIERVECVCTSYGHTLYFVYTKKIENRKSKDPL
jgi:hypothetical protein